MVDANVRRPVHGLLVLLATVSLLAGCAAPTPSPSSPASSPPPSATVVTPSATPAPSPAPTARPDGWAPTALGDPVAAAVLEPLTGGLGVVDAKTAFRLRSVDGSSPADLASRLVAEPEIAFTLTSADGDTAILQPTQPLEPSTTYRIWLPRADGTIEASWTARTAGPLAIVETVPGNASTKVPITTGIELTFDQYGVRAGDVAAHWTIKPATTGRFVEQGRTIAFVPDAALKRGQLYTVTVTRGVPLPGTGEVLEQEFTLQFETAARTAPRHSAAFPRALVDSTTSQRPVFAIDFGPDEGVAPPRSLAVTVHRIDGLAAAEAAWRAIAAAPEWTVASTAEPVPTASLPRVFSGTLRLAVIGDFGSRSFTLPVRLSAGWYVVTERWGGMPRQTLLQVSDLATFAMVSTDSTAVWVNDLRTKQPVAGATATLGAAALGQTDGRGLAVGNTPSSLPDDGVLLVVRSRTQTAFQPVREGRACGACTEAGDDFGAQFDKWSSDDWWRLFYSDRNTYRTTDTVNAWGMVRNRDTGAVPDEATLTITADSALGGAPIVTRVVRPDSSGAFAASLALRDVPLGMYVLRLTAKGSTIAETWFTVDVIAKPAWTMTVTLPRHAIIAGQSITAQVRALFFEGTPVAGTPITFWDGEASRHVRTDSRGDANATFVDRGDYCTQQCQSSVSASATLPEEGDINASAEYTVFKANGYVDVKATLAAKRLQVTGKVSSLVLSRFDALGADLYTVDPRGAPLPGVRVWLVVEEEWTTRVRTGTTYDPVTKQAVPVYRYDDHRRTVANSEVRTSRDGTFNYLTSVIGGSRGYRVTAWYFDERGRQTSEVTYASDPSDDEWQDAEPDLIRAEPGAASTDYKVGETVRVRFVGGVAKPPVQRYLYAVSQRGLRSVTIGTSDTFRTTFDAESVPSISITGVRFNGYGYETAIGRYTASLQRDTRELSVRVEADRSRYEPGGTAKVTVRTLGPGGNPVAASVYVGVVDEKLYAMQQANVIDPLADLYQSVSDGIVAVVTSHEPPEGRGYGQGGDTTGGGDGPRSDFRDWLLARLVTTDSSGRATVPVRLSDDLTSWHVAVGAVDRSLRAGSGSTLLPVGLPFFVEATLQPVYLQGDRPVLRLRGFGSELGPGARVTFTVSSDTIPMATTTASTTGQNAAAITLPKLPLGEHSLLIAARTGGRTDSLVRRFTVVQSRSTQRATTWTALTAPVDIKPGVSSWFTDVLLVDGGRGRVIPALLDLGTLDGSRADQVLAAGLSNRVLTGAFGLAPSATVDEHGPERFIGPRGGLKLVSYGSMQLDVTALAAMTGDPRIAPDILREALSRSAFDERVRRDRRLLALAGLAGLGDPVLAEVRAAAAAADLTLEEQTSLALAALYAGDEALAGRIERSILTAHGLTYGPWLRVETGTAEGDAITTARLAIVAASLGLPEAAAMDAWVVAHPPANTLVVLERALAAAGWARRVGGAEATAAVTIHGIRSEVTVNPGKPVAYRLTRDQASTARIEPVSGSVLVVTSGELPLQAASLATPDGVTMTRTITPSGTIGLTDRVVVSIRVTLSGEARREAWRVVDWAPAGLTAVGGDIWKTRGTAWTIGPDLVNGQRVEFSLGGVPKVTTWTLRYVARVVSPGTYRWEGSVLQSADAPDHGIALPARTVVISTQSTAAATPSPTPRPVVTAAPSPSLLPSTSPRPSAPPSATIPPKPTPSPAPSGTGAPGG